MSKFTEVNESEFGNMMLIWDGQGVNPLAMVTLTKHFDDYLPTIEKYQPDDKEVTTLVMVGSYPSRQEALSKIGECWDDASSVK